MKLSVNNLGEGRNSNCGMVLNCQNSSETVNALLLRCTVAREQWSLVAILNQSALGDV